MMRRTAPRRHRSPAGRRPRLRRHEYCVYCGAAVPGGGGVRVWGALRADQPQPRARPRVRIVIHDHPVPAMVIRPGSSLARPGRDLYFVVCGRPCEVELRLLAFVDRAVAEGRPPSGNWRRGVLPELRLAGDSGGVDEDPLSDEDRQGRLIAAFGFDHHCSWCFAPLPPDPIVRATRVTDFHTRLHDVPAGVTPWTCECDIIAFGDGGPALAWVRKDAGAPDGLEVLWAFCSDKCAGVFEQAWCEADAPDGVH